MTVIYEHMKSSITMEFDTVMLMKKVAIITSMKFIQNTHYFAIILSITRACDNGQALTYLKLHATFHIMLSVLANQRIY